MRKLSLLLGTLGGAMAGYVFSNKKLRTELMDAKDAQEAAKIFGKHLSTDGQVVAGEATKLAKEYHLDDKISKGKKYVQHYYKDSKKQVERFLSKKVGEAKAAVKEKIKTTSKNVKKKAKK